MQCFVCVVTLLALTSAIRVHGANILAVIPTLSSSHFVMFDVLLKELARRGHSVTAISTFPQETPVDNFKDISVRPIRKVVLNDLSFDYFIQTPETFLSVVPKFLEYIAATEKVLNFTSVSELIKSRRNNFDLIIYEMFVDDVFLGFAHSFDAPVIAISSCYMFPWVSDRFGIPANPAYVPGFYSGFSAKMSFYQRLQNTLLDIGGKLFFHYWLEPKSTEIVRKYFGASTPPVRELTRNVSLYFVNTHFSFYGAAPYPPQVVDISGLHLTQAKPLPKDLDEWMTASTHGVVYFSFGSMLRGATLPTDKVTAFLKVFGTLPQRVLWKWEDDTMAGQDVPANVKIMKWLPQRDVLAHPKVKVFISHGGLLGTTEAVVSGVPILGIPMYGDQPNNVAALVERGVAVHVDYNNISEASLASALNTLITDLTFAENTRLLSQRFLDRPQSALETAVFWTEYVIRHKGAPHLRSAAVHMPWYQIYLIDVAALCMAVMAVAFAVVYFTLSRCFRLIRPTSTPKLKRN